jgi:glycosyltransferase involved in cell wall biosynthesis
MYIKKKFNLELKIGVVIPCFKVKDHILKVIDLIPLFIDHIYIIDDCCPQGSGKHVHLNLQDNGKIKIIYHSINLGVGGAVKTGYKEALNDDCDVVVKIDGDGQMDPRLILNFIKPIIYGAADYSKGNRFSLLNSN